MNILGRLLVKGLSAILPLAVVIFFIYWIGAAAETALGSLLQAILPDGVYVPGMGLLAGLTLVLLVGLLVNVWLFRRTVDLIESAIARLPLVKTILNGIRDLMAFLARSKKGAAGQRVVAVDLGGDIRLLGIMTREDVSTTPLGRPDESGCAVYLPMSYQMGGYTVYVPRARVRPVAMSVEDALRFAVTAGMSAAETPVPPPAGRSAP